MAGLIKPYEDNQSTIRVASSGENKRLKHVAVRHHFVKEKVKNGEVERANVVVRANRKTRS